MHSSIQEQTELSESIVKALDSTMVEANDSLNSTVNGSFLDDLNPDDSVTEPKKIELSKHEARTETCKSSTNLNDSKYDRSKVQRCSQTEN